MKTVGYNHAAKEKFNANRSRALHNHGKVPPTDFVFRRDVRCDDVEVMPSSALLANAKTSVWLSTETHFVIPRPFERR